ncbi:MAG: hypothetical protein ACP5QS_06870, partial [bacterium]
LNGAALNPNTKWLQNLFTGYDADVNMGFKVNPTTDIALAIWGRDWITGTDEATVYKLYLTTPVVSNAKLTVGKFPFQLTPYTLKLVDPDVYTYIPKFDEGNYIVSGGKVDVDVKPAKVSLFAAQNPVLTPGRKWIDQVLFDPTTVPPTWASVDQFAGARVEVPNLIEFVPSLGITYYQAGLSGANNPRAEVLGADIVIAPPVKNLSVVAEYAQYKTKDDTGTKIGADNKAIDAAVSYAVTNDIKVKAGYKKVDQYFAAPGYWERILFWRNPNNIKGGYGDISWTGLKNLALNIHGAFYERDKGPSAGDKINHYLAEVKYALTSKIGLQLGYEYGQYKPTAGAEDKLGYLTFGVSYELGKDAALRLLYQNIDLKWGATPPGEQKGDLIVTQVSVKF